MKNIKIYVICFVMFGIHHTYAQSKDSFSIMRVMMATQDAWNEGNIEKFMAGYWGSPQLSFIGSKGITYGFRSVLENYKKSYPDTTTMGKLQYDILHLTLLSDTHAHMIGKYTLYRKSDTPSGYFTLIWRKFPEGWRIISDMSN